MKVLNLKTIMGFAKPPGDANEAEPKLYFCSDLHLNHNRKFLWGDRGFESHEAHTEFIRSCWFDTIRPCDIVIDLGDTVFCDGKGKIADEVSRWPGTHFVLWGNHMSGMKQIYAKAIESFYTEVGVDPKFDCHFYPAVYNNIVFVGDSLGIKAGKSFALFLSHYPHAIWAEVGNCQIAPTWHLCGHVHGNYLEANPESRDAKILDVGVDNAMRYSEIKGRPKTIFFSLDDVADIMESKVGDV